MSSSDKTRRRTIERFRFSSDDTIRRSQGTPAFQCPEIANGEDTYNGFSIDIWSAGVTLYNLVTGRLPFEADNIYLLFQTIGKGVYTIPSDLDPPLTSLLTGLLHVNRTARFRIDQIKAHDWFRRRPPRTLDVLAFPPLAFQRFEKRTMFDFLTELHRSTTLNADEQPWNTSRLIDGFQHPTTSDEPERSSTMISSRSQTTSGETLPPSKQRSRLQQRFCSLS